jgi:hypothetical protein
MEAGGAFMDTAGGACDGLWLGVLSCILAVCLY